MAARCVKTGALSGRSNPWRPPKAPPLNVSDRSGTNLSINADQAVRSKPLLLRGSGAAYHPWPLMRSKVESVGVLAISFVHMSAKVTQLVQLHLWRFRSDDSHVTRSNCSNLNQEF